MRFRLGSFSQGLCSPRQGKRNRNDQKACRPSILRRIWPHVVLSTRRGGPPPPFLPPPLLSSRLPSPRSSHVKNAGGESPLMGALPTPGEAYSRGRRRV